MTSGIDINGAPGSILRPQFMQRTSAVYAIYDTEMDTLSTLNHVSTAAFALAGSIFSFAFGLFVQNQISPATTPRGQAIVDLGVPAGIILTIVIAAAGFVAWAKRGDTLKKIKSESRALNYEAIKSGAH